MNVPRRLPLFENLRNCAVYLYEGGCKYSRLMEKLAIIKSNLRFNMRCKHYNILPKTLVMRPPIRTPSGWATARRMGKAYLSDYIQDNHYHINRINNELQYIDFYISRDAPHLISELRISGKATFNRHFSAQNHRLKINFEKMLNSQRHRNFNPNWITNISNR